MPNDDQSTNAEELVAAAISDYKDPVNVASTAPQTEAEEVVSYSDTKEPEAVCRCVVSKPYTKPAKDASDENVARIPLPSVDSEALIKISQETPNLNLDATPQSRKWRATITEGYNFLTHNKAFTSTFKQPDSEFRQSVDVGQTSLKIAPVKLRVASNENIKGDYAVALALKMIGMGETTQIPLWHTGMWITLTPPGEDELVELRRKLLNEKIELGRYSGGLIFSNISSYTVKTLVDFILDHVYNTSVKLEDMPLSELRNHILTTDLYPIIWGMAKVIYPNGFEYERACLDDTEKCNYVAKATLMLDEIYMVDNAALTDWQKTHMTHRQPYSRDILTIKRYQEEHKKSQKTSFSVLDIKFEVQTPSIATYIDAGYKWIEGIVSKVEEIVTLEDMAARNELIHQFSQTSIMRNYAHWVSSITIASNEIDDRETLEKVLNALSSNDVIRKEFNTNIEEFMNKSTIAVVAIPSYNCPSCGSKQDSPQELPTGFTNVIPLEVMSLFFELLTQRVMKILAR